MHRQCVRLVVEEAIRSKCRADVHDEVVYRAIYSFTAIKIQQLARLQIFMAFSYPELAS